MQYFGMSASLEYLPLKKGISPCQNSRECSPFHVYAINLLNARSNGSAAIKDMLDSTSLFPFRLSPMSAAHLIAMSGRLDVLRHGLVQDLIILREAAQPAANSRLFAV
jgi:hypothetical protein